jgi:hypothetical protein
MPIYELLCLQFESHFERSKEMKKYQKKMQLFYMESFNVY